MIRYLVIHEVVHLKLPDHFPHVWLAARSLCPDTERVRQCLCANVDLVFVDLEAEIGATAEPGQAGSRIGSGSRSRKR